MSPAGYHFSMALVTISRGTPSMLAIQIFVMLNEAGIESGWRRDLILRKTLPYVVASRCRSR